MQTAQVFDIMTWEKGRDWVAQHECHNDSAYWWSHEWGDDSPLDVELYEWLIKEAGKAGGSGLGPRRPFTAVIGELFKIKNGKIREIEAVMTSLPYGAKSGWDD